MRAVLISETELCRRPNYGSLYAGIMYPLHTETQMTMELSEIPELTHNDCNSGQRISIARKLAKQTFGGQLPKTDNAEQARAQTIQIVRAATILEEFGDDDDYETAARLYNDFPNIKDYDPDGAFIGTDSNENGWTP